MQESKRGECIPCRCGVMLAASPDDDVDPVKPGEQYDEEVYHKFDRPESWARPLQRVLKRKPLHLDWVVIKEFQTDVSGMKADLTGGEGRVHVIDGDKAIVALAGNAGFAGSDMGSALIEIPLDRLAVYVSPSIAKGDRVLMVKGAHQGKEALVVNVPGNGRLDVSVEGYDKPILLHQILVEHVEKIVPDSEYLNTLK